MAPRKNPRKQKETVTELPGGALQTTFLAQGDFHPFIQIISDVIPDPAVPEASAPSRDPGMRVVCRLVISVTYDTRLQFAHLLEGEGALKNRISLPRLPHYLITRVRHGLHCYNPRIINLNPGVQFDLPETESAANVDVPGMHA
jgi:hypothetical protein